MTTAAPSDGMISKRVLVTGGAGFLGSHLCDRLVAQGHEVLCVDNYFTGRRANVAQLLDKPNFELMRHDVTFPLYVEVDEIYNGCPRCVTIEPTARGARLIRRAPEARQVDQRTRRRISLKAGGQDGAATTGRTHEGNRPARKTKSLCQRGHPHMKHESGRTGIPINSISRKSALEASDKLASEG